MDETSRRNSPCLEPLVEKVMTLSRTEFANSIAALAGEEARRAAASGAPVVIPIDEGCATITFTKIEGFSFGGLVEMPRARVVIRFDGVADAGAAGFLRRFDLAFQRGGG
jgi:hypothetical protein